VDSNDGKRERAGKIGTARVHASTSVKDGDTCVKDGDTSVKDGNTSNVGLYTLFECVHLSRAHTHCVRVRVGARKCAHVCMD